MYKGKISSYSLWHFTKSFDIILSIVKNGFYPRTAKEDMNFLMKNYEHAYIGTPMVCFTDVPLDHLDEHTKQYGQFGIGMKKEWGINNRLNPILYIVDNSDLNNAILKLQWNIIQRGKEDESQINEITDLFWGMAGYFKRYMEQESKKPYYDEREWRYLVPFCEGEYTYRLMGDDLTDERIERLNMDKFPLKFSLNDIDNIIIPDSEDLDTIKLNNIYRNTDFTEEEKNILANKLSYKKNLCDE